MTMRRSPLRRRRPVAQRSAKATDGQAAYKRARADVMLRSEGRCEARCCAGCATYGSQAHHVLSRAQGGSDGPENLKWICGPCHGWVHEHPREANDLGLLRHWWEGVQ